MDLRGWLRSLGLEQYEAAFRENAIPTELGVPLSTETITHLQFIIFGSFICYLTDQGTPCVRPADINWQGEAQTLAVSLLKERSGLDRNADGGRWQRRKEANPRTEKEGSKEEDINGKYCTQCTDTGGRLVGRGV